jgi:GNAT superfamily N-acetyltransferase
MEIRELKADELDYAVLPCVDPNFRGTLKRGMNLRKEFLKRMNKEGLSVIVALEEMGEQDCIEYPGVGRVKTKDLSIRGKMPVGLIEFAPIEKTIFPVKGENLAFIHCVWVITPFWRKGVGKALVESFMEKTSHLSGAAVIAYQGESWWGFFDYMPKWFFDKFGFKEVDRNGTSVLMFKNYQKAKPPEFILSQPDLTSDQKIKEVEFFWSTQCPYSWWVMKLLEKKLKKNPEYQFMLVNTDNRENAQRFGQTFGLRINGKTVFNRIPSWDEIKNALRLT